MAEYEDFEDDPPSATAVNRLFHDEDGNSIRFFLQRELPADLLDQLKTQIEMNGGTVGTKIPQDGYVLIDPTTEKGQAILTKWNNAERPDRHIICYSFVPASIHKKSRIKVETMARAVPVFVDEELNPVKIHLDKTMGMSRATNLTSKILLYGGEIVERASRADVVIASVESPAYNALVRKYSKTDIHVEPLAWVSECIAAREYRHRPNIIATPMKKAGRPVGSARVEFTVDDDKHLAEYLATRLPFPKAGGRSGNKVYQELVERTRQYPWADRHTYQSWRNRYAKAQTRFDAAINTWLAMNPRVSMKDVKYTQTKGKKEKIWSSSDHEIPDDDFEEPEVVEVKQKRGRGAHDDDSDGSDDGGHGRKGKQARLSPFVEEDEPSDAEELMEMERNKGRRTHPLRTPSVVPFSPPAHQPSPVATSSAPAPPTPKKGKKTAKAKGKGKETVVGSPMRRSGGSSTVVAVEDGSEIEVIRNGTASGSEIEVLTAVTPARPPPRTTRAASRQASAQPLPQQKQKKQQQQEKPRPQPTRRQPSRQPSVQPARRPSRQPQAAPKAPSRHSEHSSYDDDEREAERIVTQSKPEITTDDEDSDDDGDDDDEDMDGQDIDIFGVGDQTQKFVANAKAGFKQRR